MTRLPACVLVALVVPGLAACESTADKSARIAKEGRQAVQASGRLDVSRPNADVRVGQAVVVRGAGGAVAAAVQLRNTGSRTEADVPLLIDVRDAAGKSVYRNDTLGLQAALQRVGSLPAGRTTWWVNDQVLATGTPRSVNARAGAARTVDKPPPVTLAGVHLESDDTGRSLSGTVVNGSPAPQVNVPVYAVALRGKRVVAAGRAIVAKLPAAGAPKPTIFRLFFVGDPRGARVVVSAAPSVPAS